MNIPSISLESKPLTPQQAAILIGLLNASPFKGDAVMAYLEVRMALERIASGFDVVAPAIES